MNLKLSRTPIILNFTSQCMYELIVYFSHFKNRYLLAQSIVSAKKQ